MVPYTPQSLDRNLRLEVGCVSYLTKTITKVGIEEGKDVTQVRKCFQAASMCNRLTRCTRQMRSNIEATSIRNEMKIKQCFHSGMAKVSIDITNLSH